MTNVNPSCYHISASSIAAFKACPTRFRLQYREGLRPAGDTDSQRVGTNWHAMHEVYANAFTGKDSPYFIHEEAEELGHRAVVEHLNKAYAECPSYKTVDEWELERTVLLMSFIGYQWHYQDDPLEFLASELPFELPLLDPRVGLPLSMNEVQVVGKIDHIVRWKGSICNLERKSTSRGIGDESDYWEKSQKDTQVSMYALAFRDMQSGWDTDYHPDWAVQIQAGDRCGNTLYDVWHKPTIKPAVLTQKETAEFIASGEYCGQKFDIVQWTDNLNPAKVIIDVEGITVTVEPGKKGFAIKETIAMFGARLLADIQTRPEFYFRRREIARTDKDLIGFRKQLYAVYQAMKNYAATGSWFENEQQCRATYACPFIPICYGPGADAVCDGHTTPQNFQRIFVDLTINGQEIE